mgnify:CR=1 FL=1
MIELLCIINQHKQHAFNWWIKLCQIINLYVLKITFNLFLFMSFLTTTKRGTMTVYCRCSFAWKETRLFRAAVSRFPHFFSASSQMWENCDNIPELKYGIAFFIVAKITSEFSVSRFIRVQKKDGATFQSVNDL